MIDNKMLQYVPIKDYTGFNIQSVIIAVMKAYFDDSGDRKHRFITFSVLVAADSAWSSFERAWGDVLIGKDAPRSKWGNPYFHAREAFHGTGNYRGWDKTENKEKTQDLVRALSDIIARCSMLGHLNPNGLIWSSATISCNDYELLKDEKPNLREIGRLCYEWCLFVIYQFAHYRKKHHNDCLYIIPFFDGVSSFYKRIRRLQAGRYSNKWEDKEWWDTHMSIPKLENQQKLYPLQAVDILSWTLNRHYTAGADDSWAPLIMPIHSATQTNHLYLGRADLLNILTEDGGNYRQGARIPDGFLDFAKYQQ